MDDKAQINASPKNTRRRWAEPSCGKCRTKNYRHSAVKRKTLPSPEYKKYATLQAPFQGPFKHLKQGLDEIIAITLSRHLLTRRTHLP